MTYSQTLTSKGQMTLPAAFRKKLGVKPGEQVLVELRGNQVIIQKDTWQEDLRKVQQANMAHLQQRRNMPVTDEEMDNAINEAAEKAVLDRYQKSTEK